MTARWRGARRLFFTVPLPVLAVALAMPALAAPADPDSAGGGQPAPQQIAEGVTIDVTPVQVKTQTFDPRDRPADMPELKPGEAAVTESHFSCQTLIGAQVNEQKPRSGDGACSAEVTVTSVKMTLRLEIIIWLPERGARKLSSHEEGHRRIDERFYADAESVARRHAAALIGQRYIAQAPSCDEASKAAIERAGNELCGQYMGEVQVPAARTQQIYDALTDHGRNRLNEDEAMRRAIDRERRTRQAETPPATAPAEVLSRQ